MTTLTELVERVSPVLKGRVFRQFLNADDDILSAPITPRYEAGTVRIVVAFRESTVLSAAYSSDAGAIREVVVLNSGDPLIAGALYAFDIPIASGDELNFRPADTVFCIIFAALEYGA